MANNIATSTWHLDTASASPIKTDGSGRVFVSALEFSGYAAGTDKAIFKATDAAGNQFIVTTLQGGTDLKPVSTNFGKPVWMMGLALTTLTSGIATVYVS